MWRGGGGREGEEPRDRYSCSKIKETPVVGQERFAAAQRPQPKTYAPRKERRRRPPVRLDI